VIFTLITWPVIGRVLVLAVRQGLDHAAHAFLGVVLHVTHVGLTTSSPKWATILRSSCTPFSLAAIWAFRSATFWSDVARRVGMIGEQLAQFPSPEDAALDHA
jgi:hypothetical protein